MPGLVRPSSEVVEQEQTLIVGMGPAGLVSAYYQMLLGHKVTLIDKREDPFERDRTITFHRKLLNILMQDFSNLQTLGYRVVYKDIYRRGDFGIDIVKNGKSLSDIDHLEGVSAIDLKFFKLLIEQRRTIPINEFQKYLLAKIHEKALELATNHLSSKDIIEVFTDQAVTSFDIDKLHSTANVQSKNGAERKLNFDNVIVAEGSKRTLTKMLFEIIYGKMTAIGRLPKTHLSQELSAFIEIAVPDDLFAGIDQTTRFKILRRLVAPNIRYSIMRLKHLPVLKELGWDKSRLPEFFLQYNKQKNSFYLVGELPNEWKMALMKKPQDAEIVKKVADLAIAILKIEYPEISTKFNYALLSAVSAFLVNPDYIKQNYLDLPKGGKAFIIGDSGIGSNYNFGTGFEKAARMAKAVAKCFTQHGVNKGQFNSYTPLIIEYKKLIAQFYTKKRQQFLSVKTREYPMLGTALMTSLYLNEERVNALHWIYRSAKTAAQRVEETLPTLTKPVTPKHPRKTR